MQIHGSPIQIDAPQDADMKERFFYWQGSSGLKYIHSVYDVDACPPLPGAIYVAVKRSGALRIAMTVGRFAAFWDKTLDGDDLQRLETMGADEVHVHLLAKSSEIAESIKTDLASALGDPLQFHGLSEERSSPVYLS
jgi:hypothetical protein